MVIYSWFCLITAFSGYGKVCIAVLQEFLCKGICLRSEHQEKKNFPRVRYALEISWGCIIRFSSYIVANVRIKNENKNTFGVFFSDI